MIQINITGADAAVTQTETLTAGRVGLQCTFSFDSAWDGLSKIAVCEGADTRSVVMDSDTIIVPWECLADPGYKLRVGVRGENSSGDIVIPTVWARVGKIADSPSDDIDPGQEATPSVVQQIQETAANALYIARGVKSEADSGAFIGPVGPQGPQGPQGATGAMGPAGPTGDPGVYIGNVTPTDPSISVWIDTSEGSVDIHGLPSGGTTGQVLKKTSGTDFAVEWANETADAVTSVNGQTGAVTLTIPTASNSGSPKMDGEASVGSSAEYARADHRHPTDTSRASALGVSAALAGKLDAPVGGFVGQVLKKTASGTEWADESGGGGGTTVEQIYWASTYTDTFADLQTAYLSGKQLLLRDSNQIYTLTQYDGSDMFLFSAVVQSNTADDAIGVVYIKCTSGDDWTGNQMRVVSNNYSYHYNKPSINSVTLSGDLTASDLGLGTYSKPSGGIPASDMASAVQTSLGKADTALQSFTETDPTVPSWAKASSKPTYTASEVGASPAVTEVTVSTAGSVSQALDAGKIYHFTGALTGLSITLTAAPSGQIAQYHFDFTMPSTAFTPTLTNVTLPSTHMWEASKRYEVDILNGYGVVMAW